MLDSFVNCFSECEVGSTYVKLAVFLYSVCYVIEEVLGKYPKIMGSCARG